MSAARQRGGDEPQPPGRSPSAIVASVATFVVLLMAFAIAAALLSQPGLATLAGSAAVALATAAVYHFLGRPGEPPIPPGGSGTTPGG